MGYAETDADSDAMMMREGIARGGRQGLAVPAPGNRGRLERGLTEAVEANQNLHDAIQELADRLRPLLHDSDQETGIISRPTDPGCGAVCNSIEVNVDSVRGATMLIRSLLDRLEV